MIQYGAVQPLIANDLRMWPVSESIAGGSSGTLSPHSTFLRLLSSLSCFVSVFHFILALRELRGRNWRSSVILHNLPHSLSWSGECSFLSVTGKLNSSLGAALRDVLKCFYQILLWWDGEVLSSYLPLHACPSPGSTISALIKGKLTYFQDSWRAGCASVIWGWWEGIPLTDSWFFGSLTL